MPSIGLPNSGNVIHPFAILPYSGQTHLSRLGLALREIESIKGKSGQDKKSCVIVNKSLQ